MQVTRESTRTSAEAWKLQSIQPSVSADCRAGRAGRPAYNLHIFRGSAGRRVNPAKIDRVGGSGPVVGLSKMAPSHLRIPSFSRIALNVGPYLNFTSVNS